jgi:hypothetical protein
MGTDNILLDASTPAMKPQSVHQTLVELCRLHIGATPERAVKITINTKDMNIAKELQSIVRKQAQQDGSILPIFTVVERDIIGGNHNWPAVDFE